MTGERTTKGDKTVPAAGQQSSEAKGNSRDADKKNNPSRDENEKSAKKS
jgi:hypothetical protein